MPTWMGPASTCEVNGVAGQDLFELSAMRFREELRLTPFAAEKVVSARNAFLSGS